MYIGALLDSGEKVGLELKTE